jgi:hypothetical protein
MKTYYLIINEYCEYEESGYDILDIFADLDEAMEAYEKVLAEQIAIPADKRDPCGWSATLYQWGKQPEGMWWTASVNRTSHGNVHIYLNEYPDNSHMRNVFHGGLTAEIALERTMRLLAVQWERDMSEYKIHTHIETYEDWQKRIKEKEEENERYREEKRREYDEKMEKQRIEDIALIQEKQREYREAQEKKNKEKGE